jgi:hypothetical protein
MLIAPRGERSKSFKASLRCLMPPKNVPAVLVFMGKEFIIWEDIDNKFLRACLAEFMAMHLFVLLCCGCAMVTLNLPNPNLMMVAASFGFGILTLAQIFGPLSGKHSFQT